MKYLIDSLQSYETGHGNALHPIHTEPDKGFMSDHTAMQPITAEEFREMKRSVDRKLDDLVGVVLTTVQAGAHMGVEPVGQQSLAMLPNGVNLAPVRNVQGQLIRRTVLTPYLSQKPAKEDVLVNANSNIVPRSRSRKKPTAGIHIPDVGRERGSWRKAVKQWEEGTPDMPQGLALKDWPREWYTKGMASVMGVKRSQCKLISDEYKRFAIIFADR